MRHDFVNRFEVGWPRSHYTKVRVLIAVSGGADSVALLHALATNARDGEPTQPKIEPTDIARRDPSIESAADRRTASNTGSVLANLVVAHFNHRWRGEASNEDATFVRHLADRLGIESVVGTAEPGCAQSEENARDQRYRFLKETAESLGARYIVTAHTADDQAETVLHRILRGTGVTGLAGIPRIRLVSPAVTVVRPLLEFRREEIEAYLKDIGQSFQTDVSNEDATFTRNRIRRELLPLLQREFNPGTTEALLRLSHVANEYREFMDEILMEKTDGWTLSDRECEVTLNEAALRAASPLLVREFLVTMWGKKGWPQQAMGYATWQGLCRFIESNEPAYSLPGKLECRRVKGGIRIGRQP